MPPHSLAEQFENIEKQHHAARFGMWVFLGSETLLFVGLFALYAAYRAMYLDDFTKAAAHNNVIIGTGNTLILITSSLTVALAVHEVEHGRQKRGALYLAGSMLFGVAFLCLKGLEYSQHFHEGIFPGEGYRFAELPSGGAKLFFTLYYLMTGLHAIHVIVGLIILGVLCVGCLRGRYAGPGSIVVELGGLYWHLIDLVWIFLWPLLYLSHS